MTIVPEINDAVVKKLIKVVDAGLCSGVGTPQPGSMCVEAAVCYSLGLPHGDEPICVDPALRNLKIGLNDSQWSSKATRATGLRRLAVLQLGTNAGFDSKDFMKRVALMTITTVLPIALHAVGLTDHAKRCEAATTLEEGIAASGAASDAASGVASGVASGAARYAANAANAARYAANAANAANAASGAARYAANAANAASGAARYAASGAASGAARYAASGAASGAARYAASDAVLQKFADGVADILIEMRVPAVKYLPLLDAKEEK